MDDNKSYAAQKYQSFRTQEQMIGISLQNFKQKFVFNQNSGPDAFYIDLNQPSPSQIIGMTKNQENICIYLMSQLLFKAGQILRLPISTTIVALNIAQYYYTRKNFLDYDFRQICMGSMYLACKSQETLRRTYQISSTFDYIFKMFQGIKYIKHLQLNSKQYNRMKEVVCKTQNQILFQLGFQIYKLFDIPHRYISGLISSFSRHKMCNQIVQNSWIFLNDIYRTKAPVHFPGQILASAAVYMSFKKLNISFPQKPWWILMETSIIQITQIIVLTNQMYQMSQKNQINLNKISQILQFLGKKSKNIHNVFPVTYYRKIYLEDQGDLKKEIKEDLEASFHKKQIQNENQSKKNKKNQKKKSKKKHKNRSRSRSQQFNKRVQKKGKYQNDEQTPKINKYNQKDIQSERKESNASFYQQNKNKLLISQNLDESLISKKNKVQNSKTTILDTKAMLSKISLQIKKIEVKNESNIKNQLLGNNQKSQSNENENNIQIKSSESESEQDQILAQLIQIKKKNFQKKQQKST